MGRPHEYEECLAMKTDPTGSAGSARVLMFSQRNIYEPEVWRCSFNEFEGIVQKIDAVDVLAPIPQRWFQLRKSHAMRLGKISSIPVNPGLSKIKLDRYYDLFIAVCEKPSELLNVNVVEGWKDRCKTSICWLTEFYVNQMPLYKSSLNVLSKFDHVLFMFDTNEPFKRIIRGEGSYLPAGIDTALFCPYPHPPKRSIDVLSIGRRSEQTHQALLRMARENKAFYVYDTFTDLHSYDITQHRFLMASLAKRSRYFVVNPGKINAAEETGGQSEFGYRYFEGAAPGAIMIGEVPKNKEFGRCFGYTDAVIHLPFGSEKIGEIIEELDAQPERQKRIRKTNVVNALLNHDWAYRWETILNVAGLEPLPQLAARTRYLKDLSERVSLEWDPEP